jgi:hypothetical protein
MTKQDVMKTVNGMIQTALNHQERMFLTLGKLLDFVEKNGPEYLVEVENQIIKAFNKEVLRAVKAKLSDRLLNQGVSTLYINQMSDKDRARLLKDKFEVEEDGKVVKKTWDKMTKEQRKPLVGTGGVIKATIKEQKAQRSVFQRSNKPSTSGRTRCTKWRISGEDLVLSTENGVVAVFSIPDAYEALEASSQLHQFMLKFRPKKVKKVS